MEIKLNDKIELREVGQLKGYEKNAKLHPQTQIDQLAYSISKFGFTDPLLVNAENTLVAGHGRLAAAKQLGLTQVPVIVIDYLTDDEIKALRLGHNKTNESYWDTPTLDFELAELQTVPGVDMAALGFVIANPDELKDDFALPDGDKGDMQQITFTLTNEQMAIVKGALSEAMNDCPMPDESGNQNRNGNAIFYICQQFYER